MATKTLADLKPGDQVVRSDRYHPTPDLRTVSKLTKLHVILEDGSKYRISSGIATGYGTSWVVPSIRVATDKDIEADAIADLRKKLLAKLVSTNPTYTPSVQQLQVALQILIRPANHLELCKVVKEMRDRKINHGKSTSPALEAWASRIEKAIGIEVKK